MHFYVGTLQFPYSRSVGSVIDTTTSWLRSIDNDHLLLWVNVFSHNAEQKNWVLDLGARRDELISSSDFLRVEAVEEMED